MNQTLTHPDVEKAIKLLRAGEPTKLAKHCEKALLHNNKEKELWKLYGIGLAESGNPKAARFAFNAALKLDPQDQMVLCNLITSYFHIGNKDEALKLINGNIGRLNHMVEGPLFENIMEAIDVELITYSELSKEVLGKIQQFIDEYDEGEGHV